MMDLAGKPVLQRVIERVSRASGLDETIVVTTMSAKDLPIVAFCAERGVRVFCGSENDVLDRFYQAARLVEAENIVRITADCPVMDSSLLDAVIARHVASGADYTSNTLSETYPDGEDVEVFTATALERAWKEATLLSEREHVTPYIRNHPELFVQESLTSPIDHSDQRWTLDTERDMDLLREIYRELGQHDEFFGMDEILNLLIRRKDITTLNAGIVRNEGLLKSLREDGPAKAEA